VIELKKVLQTEILVIGGGATGTGILRDLAMRGFKTILVEKGDLTHGTTGRYHGLLHSGGRYVVKDPQAARECISENRILRRIMPHCIEDTGGFFVLTPWDDPDYVPRFLQGCQKAGIPVEEVPLDEMLRQEPYLNPEISGCFRVPDASADSFLGAEANVQSARAYGAIPLKYHKVTQLLRDGKGQRVVGARCYDRIKDQEVDIHADIVVNASGAWAGLIAATIGLTVRIIGGKGTMLATNHRISNTVINRCKMPSDGDILVPAHTVSVIGTTDVPVHDPDHYAIEPWEVQLCLEEGDKLVPGFRDMRILRAWAGVRPLYQETEVSDTRQVSRAFVLLDHQERDDLPGLVTITSGKWTTYRMMAEATVDLVCEKLGVSRECKTHLEVLPKGNHHNFHFLGQRLSHIESQKSYGQLVCECELASYEQVATAIERGGAETLDDVRRDVRLGMGPCQGGFCTYRAAGILHELRDASPDQTNASLRDFLQERWKGVLPILWGQQLRQERLDELIYLSLLNSDHLPGPEATHLAPEMYTRPAPESKLKPIAPSPDNLDLQGTTSFQGGTSDVLVIGAGLAGLSAAWIASQRGLTTRLIAKGWGATHWHSGCIDVLGYDPSVDGKPVRQLRETLEKFIRDQPRHPYSLLGLDRIDRSLREFSAFSQEAGYPLHGSLETNWLLPTALGAARPTCLAPDTMIAGDLDDKAPMLVVGFENFLDFYPHLIADNIRLLGIEATPLSLELDILKERNLTTARDLAALFDAGVIIDQITRDILSVLGKAERVGFPAVLGLNDPLGVMEAFEAKLGVPVFEIPILPPSIPGMRLHNLLVKAVSSRQGRVFEGMQALAADFIAGEVSRVWTEAASRRKPHPSKAFVLATGGLLGGGIMAEYDGKLREMIFGLHVESPERKAEWFRRQFLSPQGHQVYKSGLPIGTTFQPLDEDGAVAYSNLYACGGILGSCDPIHERSLEGIALASGFFVGENL
jgi:glycerol-3-phosphate dehydrogenase